MEITKIHPITGESNKLDINVTEEALHRWKTERLSVQDVFPHLTSDEREFLISGLLPGEFDKLYPDEDKPTYIDEKFKPRDIEFPWDGEWCD